MITIKIRDWVPIGGVTHISTSYQVATDINFTNIVDNNQQDTKNLSAYYSQVVVPVNSTYYVRVMRYFSNNTNSGWGDPIAVSNSQANAGVLTYEPVIVYTPVVTVDNNKLLDPASTTYTITTNAFIGRNEGHGYTIWVVLNDNNEVIEYVKSTVNLTSITFNKGVTKFLNTKFIRVIVIHGTLTNIESGPSEITKTITEANFKIATSSDVHSPGVNLLVDIIRSPTGINRDVSKVELQDLNGAVVWEQVVSSSTNTITVPGVVFTEETQYLLVAYGIPADSKHSYVIPVRVRAAAVLDKLDRSYVYRKTVTPDSLGNRFPRNTTFGLRESYNSKIITPSLNRLQHTTMNADGSYTALSNVIGGIYLPPAGVDNAYVRPISNDRLLLDFGNGPDVRTTIYNVDYYNNSATIDATLVKRGNSIAINNGIVFTDTNEFYIARDKSTTLSKYTIVGAALNKVNIPLPTTMSKLAVVTKGAGNSLLVFGRDANKVSSYDIDTGTYTDTYTIPLEFRGRTLKQEKLVNGDVIVWKPIRVETVNGTVITDRVLDMLYIDNANSVITHIVPATGINFNTRGSILTNSGKVLLITDAPSGTNVLVFE